MIPQVSKHTAWVIAQLIWGRELNGELDELPDPFRPLALKLANAQPRDRLEVWRSQTSDLGALGEQLIKAVATVGENDTQPAVEVERPNEAEWLPLRLSEAPPGQPFPVHVLPESIQRYCSELATAMRGPLDFVCAAVLGVASAAIGQTIMVHLKKSWLESTLLYLALIARPGRMKTPILSAVVSPLNAIDIRLRQESQEEYEAWKLAKLAYAKDPDQAHPPGPQPPLRKAIVRDITRESLCIALLDNPRGVLVNCDELSGWLASFNEYKGKGQGQDRQFWLSLWSGTRVVVDRKGGRESFSVTNPFATVLGGLQPEMLSTLLEERRRDDGFIDRILFSYPEDSAFPADQWTEDEIQDETKRLWDEIVTRLASLEMTVDGPEGQPRPWSVFMTTEAKELWTSWYNAHVKEPEAPQFDPRLVGSWAKLKGVTARFALILCALRWASGDSVHVDADNQVTFGGPKPGPISSEDVLGAIALVDYFKSQLGRVRHAQTGGLADRDAREILGWIKRSSLAEFSESDLKSNIRRFADKADAMSRALLFLQDASVIRPKDVVVRSGPGRRASPRYEVHPHVVRGFE